MDVHAEGGHSIGWTTTEVIVQLKKGGHLPLIDACASLTYFVKDLVRRAVISWPCGFALYLNE